MTRVHRKRLGFLPLIAFLYASLSGGPFGQEAMLPSSGPGMTLLLLVAAAFLWGMPMILASAELGSALPVEGGFYRWTRRSLGDFWGFQSGWWIWLSSLLDQAIYPVLMVSYLEKFVFPGVSSQVIPIGPFEVQWLRWLLCMAVIVPCTLINVRGITAVGLSSLVLDLLILGPYLIFVIVAFAQWKFNPFTPLVPQGESVSTALEFGLLFAIWNYSGYELPSTASEEIENPASAIPRALFLTMPLFILGYILPLMAALAVNDNWMNWEDGTFVHIAREIGDFVPYGGTALAALVTLGTTAGCVSLFNGLLVPYTRIQFAMSEDRFLPAWLARTHPLYGTPRNAILFNVAIYSFLVLFPFEHLLTVDIWLIIPASLLVFLAAIFLRYREPGLERSFRIRGGAWGLAAVCLPPLVVAVLAIFTSVDKLIDAGEYFTIGFGLVGIVSGPAVYALSILWHQARGTQPLRVTAGEENSSSVDRG